MLALVSTLLSLSVHFSACWGRVFGNVGPSTVRTSIELHHHSQTQIPIPLLTWPLFSFSFSCRRLRVSASSPCPASFPIFIHGNLSAGGDQAPQGILIIPTPACLVSKP